MIRTIKLSDFRNFSAKTLEFSHGITVIVGDNATGKTNILESLFVLSTGKSFKAKLEVEMINYDKDIARVSGVLPLVSPMSTHKGPPAVGLPASRHPLRLEVIITRGESGWPRKRLLVNGVPKRMVDFAGNFKSVLFGPWDLDLVTESPSLRRKFLDTVLSQVDREYRRSILSYEKGLRQRNKLLFRIREEGLSRSQLSFWNQLLIKNGDYLSESREGFIEFVNKQPGLNGQRLRLDYDRSVISEGRLEQYKDEEVASATTLVGPHRDDMIFKKSESYNVQNPNDKIRRERDLAAYGSRGEQRMGILWLKIAELNFVEEKTSERPTLLLDDIFSELDHEHRDIVAELAGRQQTIITTADPHFIEGNKSNFSIIPV